MAKTNDTLGKVLEIDNVTIKKIDEVSDKIAKIESVTIKMADSVDSAWKKLANGNINEYLSKLKEVAQSNKLKINVDSSSLSSAVTQAEKLASNIGSMTTTVSNRAPRLGVTQELQNAIAKYKELQAQVDEYNKKKSLGQDTKLDDIRVSKVKEELAALSQIMAVLRANNNLLKDQIDNLNGVSSAQRSSKQVLKQMSGFYKEQAREHAQWAKEEERLAQQQERAQKSLLKLQEQWAKEQAKNREQRGKEYDKLFSASPEDALYVAQHAQTYIQQREAIKRLETAYKNLGNTEEDVAKKQKISEALKTLRKDVREADEAMGKLGNSMGGLVNWGDQIMRSLALVFSISQIRNFVTSVAEVRGEFEKTEVALSSMLQSEEKANLLFGQIKELALKSPFTVKQLVNTTRQLTAYQIEYEKLYDTTKRLSDVSAGLGVDVGRLVLAFGQVKAANFLRGTELRQFSEAGIDMLGELAKYYSELENTMVSAGEVQQRITKRMVSFGAVEAVFQRLTDKGGLFYDMQAKQADTIAGQMSNLQDSIMLMKNEIGEANEGPIKAFISMLKWLTDNYEILSVAIKLAIAGLLNYKIAAMGASSGTGLLTAAVRGLGVALMSVYGPMTLVFGLLELGVSVYQHFAKKAEIATKANKEFIDQISDIRKVTDDYVTATNAIQDANESDKEFADRTYDSKVKSLEEMLELLRGYGIPGGTDNFMKDLSPENIDDAMAEATKTAEQAAAVTRSLNIELEEMKNAWELPFLGGSLLGDNIETDANDATKAYSGLQTAIETNIDTVKMLAKENNEALSTEMTRKKEEADAEYYSRVAKLITKNQGLLWRYARTQGEVATEYISAINSISDANFKMFWAQKRLFGEYDKIIERQFSGGLEGLKEKLEQQDPYAIQFVGMLDKRLTEQNLQGWADSFTGFYIPAYLDIDFSFPSAADTSDGLDGWRKRVSDVMKEFTTTKEGPKLSGISGLSDDDLRKMSQATQAVDILRRAYSEYQETIKGYSAKEGSITKEDVEIAKEQIQLLDLVAASLRVSLEKPSKTSRKEKPFEDLITIIEKAGKEYEEFLEIMGKTESTKKTRKAFEELISGMADTVGLDGASFVASMSFDPSGIEAALGIVAKRAAEVGNKEAEKAAKTAIAELQKEKLSLSVELKIETAERGLEDAFGKFQLGEEFKKLGLEQNIIGRVFGIDTFSISDLKDKLAEIRGEMEDANGELGEKESKFIEKWTNKLNDEERKVWINTFKEYSKYLKDGVSETVKIRLEEAAALEAINRLQQSNLKLTEAERELMKQGVKRDTEKKLADQKWADFADTPLYIRLFENLESASTGALEAMKSKLDELKGSLGNMSPDVLKSIMDQYNQLEGQLIKRTPFKSLISALKEVNKLKSQGLTLDKLTLQLEEQQRTLHNLELDRAEAQEDIAYGFETDRSVEEIDKQITAQKKSIQTTIDQTDAYGKVNKALQETAQRMQLVEQIGNTFLDSAMGAIEAFGGEADESTRAVADFLGSMLGLVAQIPSFIASIKAAGLELNSALGIIGMIGMAMSALVSMFSFISQLHDARIEKQIQKELDLIEKLERAYDKLSEKIEEAYSKNTYEGASDLAEENLRKQNEALERAIAAEESKKDTDEGRIKEWRNQMEDNLEAIKDLAEQATEAYGGFGSGDNIKSAAQDFVNAWVDAFNETGDGLSGLQEQMDSFIDNAVKKQLLMRLSEQYITPLLESFDKMFDESSRGGRDMTEAELDAWRNLYEKNSKEFDEKAKAYMDALGITPTGMEPELSGLQRGIQGVTETTAQALEALLNSVRFYTSDTNSVIRQLYTAIMSADEGVNPMLAELRAHTRWLSAIHELIKSATKSTGVNGNAMKVVIV